MRQFDINYETIKGLVERAKAEIEQGPGLQPTAIVVGPGWVKYAGYRIADLPVLALGQNSIHLVALPRQAVEDLGEYPGGRHIEVEPIGLPEPPDLPVVKAQAGALYKASYAAQIARQILSGLTTELEVHDLEVEAEASRAVHLALSQLKLVLQARAPRETDEAQALLDNLIRLVNALWQAYQMGDEPVAPEPYHRELMALLEFWHRYLD